MDSGGPLASCFDEGGRAFSAAVSQEDSSAEAVGWRRSADLDRASEAERGSSTRSTPTSSGGGGVPLAPADPFVTTHERLHYPKDATDAHKEPGMR